MNVFLSLPFWVACELYPLWKRRKTGKSHCQKREKLKLPLDSHISSLSHSLIMCADEESFSYFASHVNFLGNEISGENDNRRDTSKLRKHKNGLNTCFTMRFLLFRNNLKRYVDCELSGERGCWYVKCFADLQWSSSCMLFSSLRVLCNGQWPIVKFYELYNQQLMTFSCKSERNEWKRENRSLSWLDYLDLPISTGSSVFSVGQMGLTTFVFDETSCSINIIPLTRHKNSI